MKTALDKYIIESEITKESIIRDAKINRSTFYTGLKYPPLFTLAQRKRIAKALKMKISEFETLILK